MNEIKVEIKCDAKETISNLEKITELLNKILELEKELQKVRENKICCYPYQPYVIYQQPQTYLMNAYKSTPIDG